MLKGADISNYQGNPDFVKVKKSLDFIILKASEGNGYRDPVFTANQVAARNAGLLLGYYHFARPNLGNTPEAEAAWFLSVIQHIDQGEILCLDFEVDYSDAVNWCKRFLDYIQTKTGVKPLIYLNQSQLKEFNWKPVIDADYGLWLAQYDNDPNQTNGNFPWPTIAMKQWSSSGKVSGINGNVDVDSFFGDVAIFQAYGFKGATDPTAPDTNPDDHQKKAWDNFINYRNTNPEGPEGNEEGMMARMIARDGSYKQLADDKENASKDAEATHKAYDSLEIEKEGFETQVKSYQQFVDKMWTTLNISGSTKPKSTETILAEVTELIEKEKQVVDLEKNLDTCGRNHLDFVKEVTIAAKSQATTEDQLIKDVKKLAVNSPAPTPQPDKPSYPFWQFWHWF